MWVRRHDERNEARSVERFSTAMRVLSRRSGASAARRTRDVVMPARSGGEDVHVSGPSPRPAAARPVVARAAGSRASRSVPRPAGRRGLAQRRRRTLLALLLVTVLAAVLGVAGLVPLWSGGVVGLLLVGFVVHLRSQARIAQETARRRAAASRRLAARQQRRQTADRLRRTPRAGGAEGDVVDDGVVDDVLTEAGWEPREVPLPTYVTKASAPRETDELDSAERAGARPVPEDEADEALDDEPGTGVERRRVVGE
jgi:hypothetical protein